MYFNFFFCFFAWCYYRITCTAIGLKICTINAGIKKYKSIIKKKKKKHNKIVLLVKYKLKSIEVLISKALFYSNFSRDDFALINNVLKIYYINKEFKNLKP